MPRTILPAKKLPTISPQSTILAVKRMVVRMPDGAKVEADTIAAKVGTVMSWIVKCPVAYKTKPRKKTLFAHGLYEGEYGIYLPVPRVWLFNRTEPTIEAIVRTVHVWREFALGGKPEIAVQCITDMVGAGNPKDAKKNRNMMIEFHGMWQIGNEKHTRMKGREALVRHMETLKKLKRCPQEATDADIKMAWEHDG